MNSKRGRTSTLLAIWLALFACTAQAATIFGKAIKIADGDSITILDVAHKQFRIRIDGIDAGERPALR